MKKIRVSDKYALVDDDLAIFLSQYKWYFDHAHYATTKDGVRMHRLVMGLCTGDGKRVDHINRNPLDNRQENLRICSNQQNMMNSRVYANNKSGYKGVFFLIGNRKKPWVAKIKANGKQISKYHSSKEDAAKCYNALAYTHFGEYARMNIL